MTIKSRYIPPEYALDDRIHNVFGGHDFTKYPHRFNQWMGMTEVCFPVNSMLYMVKNPKTGRSRSNRMEEELRKEMDAAQPYFDLQTYAEVKQMIRSETQEYYYWCHHPEHGPLSEAAKWAAAAIATYKEMLLLLRDEDEEDDE